MKKLLCLSIALLFTGLVNGECAENGCNTTIKRLYATGLEGSVYIKITDSVEPLNCTPRETSYLTLKTTHPLFKEIYSMMLTATVSKSPVRVRMIDNSPICEVSYTWIDAL